MAHMWNPFKKFFDEEPEVDESSLDDCRQLGLNLAKVIQAKGP